MSGVAFAITAGVGFGLFQAVSRRANRHIDPYLATFGLLSVGTAALSMVVVLTQDIAQLASAPISSLLLFAAAGIIHFYFGWTFLTLSQQHVGASRTSATAASAPLIGSVLASFALDEPLGWVTGVGVALVVAGVASLSLRAGEFPPAGGGGTVPWYGIGAAMVWGTSPLFIRWGLAGLDSPLLGVTVAISAATAAYGVSLAVTRRWRSVTRVPLSSLGWLGLAGVLVAIAIACQWASFDAITVAVAITLHQLAAPVVIVAAPLVVGRDMEPITLPLVFGASLVLSGSILVVLA